MLSVRRFLPEKRKVIEWHYVRERSEEEWASLKPRHIKYQSDMPGLAFKALGGTERDGHWVERVLVTHIGDDARSLKLHIEASGPDDKHPVKGTVLLQAQSDSIAQKVTSVEVLLRRVLKKPTEALLRQSSEQKCEPERFV